MVFWSLWQTTLYKHMHEVFPAQGHDKASLEEIEYCISFWFTKVGLNNIVKTCAA